MDRLIPLPDGLHIVQRPAENKPGFMHRAIADVGNRIQAGNFGPYTARILDFSPEGLGFLPFANGEWALVRTIQTERAAVDRIWAVAKMPRREYAAITNNCEHYVSFVEAGVRESPQAFGGLLVASLVLLVVVLSTSEFA